MTDSVVILVLEALFLPQNNATAKYGSVMLKGDATATYLPGS
jgi:hypothetical protein